MMRSLTILITATAAVSAFQLGQPEIKKIAQATEGSSRLEFVQQLAIVSGAATLFTPFQGAYARGRATLEYAYERYSSRILSGGEFYKNDLRILIQKMDWQGIKDAVAEPPKKSKADLAKADGGISERAAKAGRFSDARVLVACDLYAAAFSDSSVSEKTKKMKKEVEELRNVVQSMEITARQALGEDSSGGGLFGFGAKKPSKEECAKKIKELYIEGGTVWNRYIFYANEGLPVQLSKFPFL